MKFTGKGLIYDPDKKKIILNFNNIEEYETDDKRMIELLNKAEHVICIDETVKNVDKEESDVSGLTRKELIEMAKASGITGADRMTKDEIIHKLGA